MSTKIHDEMTGLSLTAPQDLALRVLRRDGEVAAKDVKAKGLDHRALRALCRLAPDLVTLVTEATYRFTAPTPAAAPPPDGEEAGGEEDGTSGDGALPFATVASLDGKACKATKQGRPCLCGCNNTTKPGSKFCCGHDSKLHGMIRKIDAGKADLSILPPGEEVLDWLSKCSWLSQHPNFATILASARLPAGQAARDGTAATEEATEEATAGTTTEAPPVAEPTVEEAVQA